MSERPVSITVISWIFIALGCIGLVSALLPLVDSDSAGRVAELKSHGIVWLARVFAMTAGAFMLYGFNWARWLLVIWMGFHIGISALHSPLQLLFHVVIFSAILYFLFRRQSTAYFRSTASP